MSILKDSTGMRFGKLTVLRRGEDVSFENKDRICKRPTWVCLCDCGNIKEGVLGSNLTRGTTTSCGCHAKELMSIRSRKHGGCANAERLYNVWVSMIKRCERKSNDKYDSYGGRGIKVCPEWHEYSSFREWAYASGYDEDAPTGECTLDRIDVNGNYEPENCRWADMKVQQNNKTSNIYITCNGETHTLKEWSRIRGINYRTLYSRYRHNWEIARMLNFSD